MAIFSNHHAQTAIAKTGFLVSLISYAVFLLSDALRPGFVARYFSVHLFLAAAIFFGFWWLRVLDKEKDRPLLQWIFVGILAILSGMLTWRLGSGFAEYHLFATVLSVFFPILLLKLLRS